MIDESIAQAVKDPEFQARFTSYTHWTPECWEWTRRVDRHGYGLVSVLGKRRLAHRVAWMMEHGVPVPPGLYVCHTCDNPRCVRPSHLFTGTNRENQLDCVAKGRMPQAERSPHSKLSRDAVLEIRRAAGSTTYAELGRRFGVTPDNIRAIVVRRSWKSV